MSDNYHGPNFFSEPGGGYVNTQAHALLSEMDIRDAEMTGKRVRVVRVLVYEGDYEWMKRQLGNSLSPGDRVISEGRVIRVAEGEWEVIRE